jgi:GMP synthase (glutamine-hydrolysing)
MYCADQPTVTHESMDIEMIVFIHFEHERLQSDTALWRFFASKTLEIKYRLEALCNDSCLIIRYDRLTPFLLQRLEPKAAIFGGNYTGFQHFTRKDLEDMRAVFRNPVCPILCLCGSFQLMAQTYGSQVGLIAPRVADPSAPEADTDTPLPPGLNSHYIDYSGQDTRSERGFMPVNVLKPHPLFEGVNRNPVVFQLHGGEVKFATEAFQVIANSNLCPVQAMVHKEYPLIGTQFHPEMYDDSHPDGRRILKNFFKIAGFSIDNHS